MKKIILTALLAVFVVVSVAYSNFFPDIIVTSPNGIWTDTRAYTTLDAAFNAIGGNIRDVYIAREEIVVSQTIPETVNLHFFYKGAINNSGTLNIQTRIINAPARQIFNGTGAVNFATGTVVKSSWFVDFVEAVLETNNDYVTLLVSEKSYVTADCAIGDDVILRSDAPTNRIVSDVGFTLSNIKKIEAVDYQLFAGSGDFDFLDGTQLKLVWFNRLRSIRRWIENEEVTLIVTESSTVDYDNILPTNLALEINKGAILTISAGRTLTPNGPFKAGLYQVFDGAGNVSFGVGTVDRFPIQWTGGFPNTDCTNAIIRASSAFKGPIFLPYTDSSSPYIITSEVEVYGLVSNSRDTWVQLTGTGKIKLKAGNFMKIKNISINHDVTTGPAIELPKNSYFTEISDFRIDGLSATAVGQIGIYFYDDGSGANAYFQEVWIRNFYIHNIHTPFKFRPDGANPVIVGGDNYFVDDCVFENGWIVGCTYAFDIYSKFRKNTAKHIYVGATGIHTSYAVLAKGYIIDFNHWDIWVDTGSNPNTKALDYEDGGTGNDKGRDFWFFRGDGLSLGATNPELVQDYTNGIQHQGVRLKHRTISNTDSPYTASIMDEIIDVNTTAGDVTVVLPPVSGYSGKGYVIKKSATSANKVIIDPDGTEAIDGILRLCLYDYGDFVKVYTDGSSWKKEAYRVRYRDVIAAQKTGSSPIVVNTITIPEDTLGTNTILKIRAGGLKGGGAGNKTLDLHLGSTNVTFHAAANDTKDWQLNAVIAMQATNIQRVSILGYNGTTLIQDHSDWAEDSAAGDLILKIEATLANTADSIYARCFYIDFEYN